MGIVLITKVPNALSNCNLKVCILQGNVFVIFAGMKVLRLLLLPFALLYGAVVFLRHKLYDFGVFKSVKFEKPVIIVGNLVVGGAGKSPLVLYLVQLLNEQFKIATLSRGYGRSTKGFRFVGKDDSVIAVGDEPLQIKKRFPGITVADDEDRVNGVSRLIHDHDVIILDDAFQHRSIKSDFNVLVFEYESLQKNHFLLPAGNYRDLFSRRKKATIIMVSKCPDSLSNAQRENAIAALRIQSIPVFFSYLTYGALRSVYQPSVITPPLSLSPLLSVLLITGIANPKPLRAFLKNKVKSVSVLDFPDHHRFTVSDIKRLIAKFDEISGDIKCMITTEKDAMRLHDLEFLHLLKKIPIYYIPIEATLFESDKNAFEMCVLNYCEKNDQIYQ